MNTAIPMGDNSRPSKAKHAMVRGGYPADDGSIQYYVSCTKCGTQEVGFKTEDEAIEFEKAHVAGKAIKTAQVLYTSKGHEVEIKVTDEEAARILGEIGDADIARNPNGNSFAFSLAEQFHSKWGWSTAQRAWAHKLVNDRNAPRPAPKLSERAFPRLVDLLQTAAMNLTYPKVVFSLEDGRQICLSIASNKARVPGSLNVTDGPKYGGAWYGRIHTDGRYEAGRQSEDWICDALEALNEDPSAAAREYGRRTGACCFCRRELSTTESLDAGYGPVCADNYGLPWG